MRKLILSNFFFFLLSLAIGQDKVSLFHHFKWGAKAGVNVSTIKIEKTGLYGSNFETDKPRTGIASGLFATVDFKNYCTLQVEATYSQEGAHMSTGSDQVQRIKLEERHTYIKLPILIRRELYKSLYVTVGFGHAFTQNIETKFFDIYSSGTRDTENYRHKGDNFVITGLGYVSKYNIGIDIRHEAGLNNVYKSSGPSEKGIIEIGKQPCFTRLVNNEYL